MEEPAGRAGGQERETLFSHEDLPLVLLDTGDTTGAPNKEDEEEGGSGPNGNVDDVGILLRSTSPFPRLTSIMC